MKKKYTITMPISGHVTLDVKAKNEKDALKVFYEKIDDFDDEGFEQFDSHEWNYMQDTCSGMTCNLSPYERKFSVEEIKEVKEEKES